MKFDRVCAVGKNRTTNTCFMWPLKKRMDNKNDMQNSPYKKEHGKIKVLADSPERHRKRGKQWLAARTAAAGWLRVRILPSPGTGSLFNVGRQEHRGANLGHIQSNGRSRMCLAGFESGCCFREHPAGAHQTLCLRVSQESGKGLHWPFLCVAFDVRTAFQDLIL